VVQLGMAIYQGRQGDCDVRSDPGSLHVLGVVNHCQEHALSLVSSGC